MKCIHCGRSRGLPVGGLVLAFMLAWEGAWLLQSPSTEPGGWARAQTLSVAAPPPPSFATVAKSAAPAVVNISSMGKEKRERHAALGSRDGAPTLDNDDALRRLFPHLFGMAPPPAMQRSLGSGFIISDDGYIVTNNHVIGDGEKITVSIADGEDYEASVVGVDKQTDLALLKIHPRQPLPIIPLGVSSEVQVGDWVVAIGNSFGLSRTVTAGIVSGKGRLIGNGPYDDFIQTDASINPGNSGGPLLNLKGEVVGINTAIFTQSGGNVGIGFATPVDLAKSVVTELKQHGSVTRAWLGVTVQPLTPELAASFGLPGTKGALVAEVVQGGPAGKAGIHQGDVITAFNGAAIQDSHQLPSLIAQAPVGSQAEIAILRNGKSHSLTATLKKTPG